MSLSESHGKTAILEPVFANYLNGATLAGAAFLLLCILTLGLA
jgi:hypothetical protein